MNNIELKSCPFCGGKAVIDDIDVHVGSSLKTCPSYYVKCPGCGVSSTIYYKEADAIDAWNRRTPNDQVQP